VQVYIPRTARPSAWLLRGVRTAMRATSEMGGVPSALWTCATLLAYVASHGSLPSAEPRLGPLLQDGRVVDGRAPLDALLAQRDRLGQVKRLQTSVLEWVQPSLDAAWAHALRAFGVSDPPAILTTALWAILRPPKQRHVRRSRSVLVPPRLSSARRAWLWEMEFGGTQEGGVGEGCWYSSSSSSASSSSERADQTYTLVVRLSPGGSAESVPATEPPRPSATSAVFATRVWNPSEGHEDEEEGDVGVKEEKGEEKEEEARGGIRLDVRVEVRGEEGGESEVDWELGREMVQALGPWMVVLGACRRNGCGRALIRSKRGLSGAGGWGERWWMPRCAGWCVRPWRRRWGSSWWTVGRNGSRVWMENGGVVDQQHFH
jgi:hypothetical protein